MNTTQNFDAYGTQFVESVIAFDSANMPAQNGKYVDQYTKWFMGEYNEPTNTNAPALITRQQKFQILKRAFPYTDTILVAVVSGKENAYKLRNKLFRKEQDRQQMRIAAEIAQYGKKSNILDDIEYILRPVPKAAPANAVEWDQTAKDNFIRLFESPDTANVDIAEQMFVGINKLSPQQRGALKRLFNCKRIRWDYYTASQALSDIAPTNTLQKELCSMLRASIEKRAPVTNWYD